MTKNEKSAKVDELDGKIRTAIREGEARAQLFKMQLAVISTIQAEIAQTQEVIINLYRQKCKVLEQEEGK